MAKPNLFWMDEVLLKGASGMGAALLLALLGLAAMDESTRAALPTWSKLTLASMTIAPIAMAIVGRQIRKRDQRASSLSWLLENEVEVSANELIRNSDWTAETLDRAVRDLNNAAVAHLIWDRQTGWIQDGRLRRSVATIDQCDACSAKVAAEVMVGSLRGFECPYCGAGLGDGRIFEERARIVDALESDRSLSTPVTRPFSAPESSFSIGVFLLLLFFFWPAAILYAVKARNASEGSLLSF